MLSKKFQMLDTIKKKSEESRVQTARNKYCVWDKSAMKPVKIEDDEISECSEETAL